MRNNIQIEFDRLDAERTRLSEQQIHYKERDMEAIRREYRRILDINKRLNWLYSMLDWGANDAELTIKYLTETRDYSI